mmetsp:Transcript_43008/g.92222  ORF Transcript_43008/g.92222 Transcript_43008/m.92222 type:complete len:238 (+) Transcript_43008:253-966(+)
MCAKPAPAPRPFARRGEEAAVDKDHGESCCSSCSCRGESIVPARATEGSNIWDWEALEAAALIGGSRSRLAENAVFDLPTTLRKFAPGAFKRPGFEGGALRAAAAFGADVFEPGTYSIGIRGSTETPVTRNCMARPSCSEVTMRGERRFSSGIPACRNLSTTSCARLRDRLYHQDWCCSSRKSLLTFLCLITSTSAPSNNWIVLTSSNAFTSSSPASARVGVEEGSIPYLHGRKWRM